MKLFNDIIDSIKERFSPLKSPIPLNKKNNSVTSAISSKIEPTMTDKQWRDKRLAYIRKGFTFPDMTTEEKMAIPKPSPTLVPKQKQPQAYNLPTPPNDIGNIIDSVFGDLSPTAKQVAASENALFIPNRDSAPNLDGSIDRGIFQINSDTFDDYMRRMPDLLRQNGITSFEDMKDPLLNTKMAKIIHNYQGWGAWRGPERVGLYLK